MILTSGGGYLLSFALDLRRGAATPSEVFPYILRLVHP
jgi:hypothetical protein